MRRYKIVACILLILSIFGSVLAAPVATRTDAVDRGDNVIIGLGKRVGEGTLVAQAQQKVSSPPPDWFWNVWAPARPQISSSAPNYATQPGTLTAIQPVPPRPKPKSKTIFQYILSKLGKLKFWR